MSVVRKTELSGSAENLVCATAVVAIIKPMSGNRSRFLIAAHLEVYAEHTFQTSVQITYLLHQENKTLLSIWIFEKVNLGLSYNQFLQQPFARRRVAVNYLSIQIL